MLESVKLLLIVFPLLLLLLVFFLLVLRDLEERERREKNDLSVPMMEDRILPLYERAVRQLSRRGGEFDFGVHRR